MTNKKLIGLMACLLVLTSANVYAQCPDGSTQSGDYCYTESGGEITITGYTGLGGDVEIPSIIDGMPVTTTAQDAFYGYTSLTGVTFPESLTTIGISSFRNCTNLTSVTFSNGLQNIRQLAFRDCEKLTSVSIPASVTTVEYGIFSNCDALTGIQVDAGNTSFTSVDGILYAKDMTRFLQYPAAKPGSSFIIPDTITEIDHSAFGKCSNLESVIIPDSITTIEEWTFHGCEKLSTVNIPDNVTSIGGNAFSRCSSLTNVTIPAGVTSIGDSVFQGCWDLKEAIFLGDAPSMGNYVFLNTASDFSICYTPAATGFTTPTWEGYPAADCVCSYHSDCLAGDGCLDNECESFPVTSDVTAVVLKGPGVVDVTYKPNGQDIALINLADTTEKSSLTISSKLKGTVVYLDEFSVDGSLKAIKGKAVVLTGPLTATDGIGKMRIAATEAGSSIETAWIGKLAIAGDFAGDMSLTGEGSPPKDMTLGKASIKGTLDNAQLLVSGNVGLVKVGFWGAGSTLAVGVEAGNDGRFFTEDDVATGGWCKNVKFKDRDLDNDGEDFGIIVDEFFKLKPKQRALLPLHAGDFWLMEK